MHQTVTHSLLPTIGVGELSVHSLQFADDLLLFMDGSVRSANVIKVVLDGFTSASGLKINFRKSSFLPINLDSDRATNLATLFGCQIGAFPFTYLGLPFSLKALCKQDYLPLLEKLGKRLAGWKSSALSRGGRLVLLNSVLSSTPAFFCSTFRLPVWVTKEIDKIRRGFFWKGKRLTNGFHCLVNWNQICRPKQLGGLGVRRITDMNAALLMKNLWKYYCADNLPWVQMLKTIHYRKNIPCSTRPPPAVCSPFWCGVLHTSNSFHFSICHKLGDGARTPFWHGRWAGGDLLRDRFPNLFGLASHKHIGVKDWLTRFGTKRNLGIRPSTAEAAREIPLLQNLIGATRLTGAPDELSWRWSSRRGFSVRDAYSFITFDGVNDTKIPHLWNLKIPLKIKIFLWLAARNRIPTADLLRRRGWIGPTMCSLCRCDEESAEHLFFGCDYARGVWAWILAGESSLLQGLLVTPGNLATRWIRARGLIGRGRKPLLDLGVAACCWELWLERNQRLFEEDKSSITAVCGRRIVECINFWGRAWGDFTSEA